MAQLGSALDWGSRGRRFKSCQPDRNIIAAQGRFTRMDVAAIGGCPGAKSLYKSPYAPAAGAFSAEPRTSIADLLTSGETCP